MLSHYVPFYNKIFKIIKWSPWPLYSIPQELTTIIYFFLILQEFPWYTNIFFKIHNLIHLICWITFIIDSNFIFYLLHNYISLYECIIGNEPSLVDRLSVGNVFSSKLELWNIVFQTKKIFFLLQNLYEHLTALTQ